MNMGNSIIRGVLDFEYGNNAKIRSHAGGVLKPFGIDATVVNVSNDLSVTSTTTTNKIVVKAASYGTGDPPATGVEGQLYFKII